MINITELMNEVFDLVRERKFIALKKKIQSIIDRDDLNVLEVVCVLRTSYAYSDHIPDWNKLVNRAAIKITANGRDAESLLKGLR